MMAEISVWEGLADWLCHTATNQANTMLLQWWKKPPDGWKQMPRFVPPPETLSQALQSKSYGDVAPQKELRQIMGLISIGTWVKEHGIKWVISVPISRTSHIMYIFLGNRKIKGLLKTTQRAMDAETFKHWYVYLAKATWLVNTRESAKRANPVQSKPLCNRKG